MVTTKFSTSAAVIPVEANATPAPVPCVNFRLMVSLVPAVNAELPMVYAVPAPFRTKVPPVGILLKVKPLPPEVVT